MSSSDCSDESSLQTNKQNIFTCATERKRTKLLCVFFFSYEMESFIKNNVTIIQGNIQLQSRVVVNNVLSFFTELKEDPAKLKELNFDQPHELTAMICAHTKKKIWICGTSLRTAVDRIKKESVLSSEIELFIKNDMNSNEGNIHQQCQVVINNVLRFLTELKEDPAKLTGVNFDKPRELTSMICGISLRTVDRIKKESVTGEIKSPRKQVRQPRPVTNLHDFEKSVIKEIVTSLYANGEIPTAKKILTVAMERIDGFKCSLSSMRTILHELGYRFTIAPDGRQKFMD